jgi:transposase
MRSRACRGLGVEVWTGGRCRSSPRSRWAASRYRRSWAGRSFSGVRVLRVPFVGCRRAGRDDLAVLFEAHGLDPWLVNAKDVKHLPGRPKTDRLDAVWLCKVAERQMLRPSFVPPADVRRLRDLTRYRIDLVGVRTAEKSRVEKLLEDACLKLSVVGSDIFGVSGRAMMAALVAGERNPTTLAELARTRMRTKIGQLAEAFAGLRLGTFDDHHRFLLARMLARIDAVNADITAVDTQIGQHLAPFGDAVAQLDEIPGIGPTAAAIIIAEIGLDMTRFPTPPT